MKKSELRIGVVLSYVNLALSTAIPLVYTPIMLRMLGQSEYGLYALAVSAVSYLSLLSFGMGSTIIRYISKYRAENDKDAEEKAFGFFLLLYCVLACVVLVCGTLISVNAAHIFDKSLNAEELSKIKTLLIIMTVNSAVSFPCSVFSSVTISHEKYIFRKLIDTFPTIITPCANLLVLYLGHGSVGMALVAAILQVITLPIYVVYCIKNLQVKPRIGLLPGKLVKEMFGFSAFVFLATIVDMLFWQTDKVILGMLVGSTAVGVYNLGGTFNSIVMNLSTSISGVLAPKITGMVVKESTNEELSELFIRVGRLQYIIIALILSGFIVFGRQFIYLWVGPEYEGTFWVAILTMFPLAIPLIQNTGLNIITAQNKHRFRSLVFLGIAILNVISTYLCVPYWGIIGAALCSCVSYLLGQGLIMNIYYYKVTKLDIPQFWRNILKMSPIPVIMTLLGVFLNKYIIANNWIVFFVEVAVFSIIYVLLMHCFCFNSYEKNIYMNLVKKVIGKLGKRG